LTPYLLAVRARARVGLRVRVRVRVRVRGMVRGRVRARVRVRVRLAAAVLDARLDWQRLVVGPVVALVRVRVEDGGPYAHGALLRRHGHVEPGEVGQPALVAVAHVHEHGEHPRPPRGGARRVLVVVRLVELAGLVPEHLHRLGTYLCLPISPHISPRSP